MTAIDLVNISKSFGAHRVLSDVSLAVAPGELLAVVGPSGCGKSTLLRIVAGLEGQDSGEVRIDGVPIDDLAPKQRDVAMVFQSYALYPHMTVGQNIALPLVMRELTRAARLPLAAILNRNVRRKRAAIQDRVRQAASVVGLGGCLDRKPGQLSGGQRQRVALARAIVRRPRAFLMDEPLSNLDAKLRGDTRTEIVSLQQQLGVTTLYVTHDQVEAMTMATRIAVMFGGRVVQVGTPREIYETPATLDVATFVGTPRINVFPVEVIDDDKLRMAGQLISGISNDRRRTPAHVAVRPEHIVLAEPGPDTIIGSIGQVEFLGSEGLIHVDLNQSGASETTLKAIVKAEAASLDGIEKGRMVGLRCAWAHLHLFDVQGARLDFEAQTRLAATGSSRRRAGATIFGART